MIIRSNAAKELMRTVMREGKGGIAFSDREQAIVEGRLLSDNPKTLRELASDFGVSGSRIDDIAKNTILKIEKLARRHYRDVPVLRESIKEQVLLQEFILQPVHYKEKKGQSR